MLLDKGIFMNICLIGDLSSFHVNLKYGLEGRKNTVCLISSGDGWKRIKGGNTYIGFEKDNNLLYKIKNRIRLLKIISEIHGYDVVQLMTPFVLWHRFFPNKLIIRIIKARNRRVFLVAASTDSIYLANADKILRYSPIADFLKYDVKKNHHILEKRRYRRFNRFIANEVDGIIPVAYEYQAVYKSFKNVKNVVHFPLNTDAIYFSKNIVKDKILVFHGLSRYGFKGTKLIEEAFKILKEKYYEEAEFIIKGKLPLSEYLDLLRRMNIVIDQVYSYSLGMNGIYAMAMGKVVLGGAEPESIREYAVDSSPIINILPRVSDIVDKISYLIEHKELIEELGYQSRCFVEKYHSSEIIAAKYEEIWKE
jgi:glycosyltransferase involved in cell wall biosynthesis